MPTEVLKRCESRESETVEDLVERLTDVEQRILRMVLKGIRRQQGTRRSTSLVTSKNLTKTRTDGKLRSKSCTDGSLSTLKVSPKVPKPPEGKKTRSRPPVRTRKVTKSVSESDKHTQEAVIIKSDSTDSGATQCKGDTVAETKIKVKKKDRDRNIAPDPRLQEYEHSTKRRVRNFSPQPRNARKDHSNEQTRMSKSNVQENVSSKSEIELSGTAKTPRDVEQGRKMTKACEDIKPIPRVGVKYTTVTNLQLASNKLHDIGCRHSSLPLIELANTIANNKAAIELMEQHDQEGKTTGSETRKQNLIKSTSTSLGQKGAILYVTDSGGTSSESPLSTGAKPRTSGSGTTSKKSRLDKTNYHNPVTQAAESKDKTAGRTKDTKAGMTKDPNTGGTKDTKTRGTNNTKIRGTKDTNAGRTKDTEIEGIKDTTDGRTKDTMFGRTKDTKDGRTKDTMLGGTKYSKTPGTKENKGERMIRETSTGGTKDTKIEGTKDTKAERIIKETRTRRTKDTKTGETKDTKIGGTKDSKARLKITHRSKSVAATDSFSDSARYVPSKSRVTTSSSSEHSRSSNVSTSIKGDATPPSSRGRSVSSVRSSHSTCSDSSTRSSSDSSSTSSSDGSSQYTPKCSPVTYSESVTSTTKTTTSTLSESGIILTKTLNETEQKSRKGKQKRRQDTNSMDVTTYVCTGPPNDKNSTAYARHAASCFICNPYAKNLTRHTLKQIVEKTHSKQLSTSRRLSKPKKDFTPEVVVAPTLPETKAPTKKTRPTEQKIPMTKTAELRIQNAQTEKEKEKAAKSAEKQKKRILRRRERDIRKILIVDKKEIENKRNSKTANANDLIKSEEKTAADDSKQNVDEIDKLVGIAKKFNGENADGQADIAEEIDHESADAPAEIAEEIDCENAEDPAEIAEKIDHKNADEPYEIAEEIDCENAEGPAEIAEKIDCENADEPAEIAEEIDCENADGPGDIAEGIEVDSENADESIKMESSLAEDLPRRASRSSSYSDESHISGISAESSDVDYW